MSGSKERQPLTDTYKENTLRYELNRINNENKEVSPRLVGGKPRTCTNRDSYRMNFEHEQLQKSSSKLLEMLKMELRRKEESPEA